MRTTPIYDELLESGPLPPSSGEDGPRPATGTADAGSASGCVMVHTGTPGRHREPAREAQVRALR
ncbi:MAG TPA: hypothetical protein VGH89_05960 [Pseudonocardia sp.]